MENIIENNKLIAEFMGVEEPEFKYYSKVIIIEDGSFKGCTGLHNGHKEDDFYSITLKDNSSRWFERDSFKVVDEREYNYHSDWNWLMEVVEKIEEIEIESYIDFHIMPDAVIVRDQIDESKPLILINKSEGKGSIETQFTFFETKIKAVYNACVIFIKWYNEQNKK